MTHSMKLPIECPYCRNLIDHRSVPSSEPGFHILAPKATVLELDYAQGIGRSIGHILWALKWPRRLLINRLHHRVDMKIDQGLKLWDCDFAPIDFHDSYLDETMPKDPTDRWLLSYARLCETGLAKDPIPRLYERLARIDLALRAAGLKLP